MPVKKTVSKRVVRKATIPRSVRPKTFALKRSYYQGQLKSAGTTAQYAYGSAAFTLNSLPNYTEFTNLFDQYRINKVTVQAFPRQTMETDTTNPAVNIFHYAFDHTDVTAPSAESDVCNMTITAASNRFKPFTMTLKPVAATTVYQGITANGYAPAKPSTWIDCKSYAVNHYGLKFAWFNNNSINDIIDFYVTMWVEFREPN